MLRTRMQIPAAPDADPKGNSWRALQLVWVGILSAVVFYGVVAYVITAKAGADVPRQNFSDPPVLVLYAISLAMFVAAFILPSMMSGTPPGGRTTVEAHVAADTSARVRKSLIVRYALLESPAIFGLVAALRGSNWLLFVPPAILSIVGLVASAPRQALLRPPRS